LFYQGIAFITIPSDVVNLTIEIEKGMAGRLFVGNHLFSWRAS